MTHQYHLAISFWWWQRVMMTSCAKMSNLQQHNPSHRLSFLPVCWLNSFSTAETLKNLYRLAQRWCRQMAFAHLLLQTPQKITLLWDQISLWKSFSHPRLLTIWIRLLLWIQWQLCIVSSFCIRHYWPYGPGPYDFRRSIDERSGCKMELPYICGWLVRIIDV
jgi:hypothetical protein